MAEELFDLTIRGGLLVDGSGAPARLGDVGVRYGRIAALGTVRGPSLREIDASGCVVAPGFIDVHTHYDAELLWDRALGAAPRHGVTTVVIGSCGIGIAPARREHRELVLRTLEGVAGMPYEALRARLGDDWGFESFAEYLAWIEARGTLINVGALVGHTPLRIAALGAEASEREATPDEVAAMSRCVADALRAGALGFATSRSPAHLGLAGRPLPSRAAALCEVEALAANLGHSGRGVLQVAVGRGLFLRELAAIAGRTGRPVSWSALLAGARGMEDYLGILKRSAELQAQGLAVVPQVSCRPLPCETAPMNSDERVVAELLQHPAVMLGLSDAGPHAAQPSDAGFATHLLGYWVRERGTLGLEQAVRLLTSRAAEVFGIEDRGRLALGLAADLAIFDPERVGCGPLRRVRDVPGGAERLVCDASGIRAVIVNGERIREGDRDLCADPEAELPGRLLRSGVA